MLTAALALSACGSNGDDRARVLAAASLTDAFTELGGAELSFAGSQALARQLEDGAPADVFASADERTMQSLLDKGLVERPQVFARNRLTIAVERGNPRRIAGLGDLDRDDLTVVLADPAVPAGRYAEKALDKAGVNMEAASLELDVRAALAKVASGEADAAIVYQSDVAGSTAVTSIAIATEHNVEATYPIAVVRDTSHRAAAEAFVRRVLSPVGQRILKRHGFLPR